MKVAVFGASGFVGHNIINLFEKRGIDYIGSDIQKTPIYEMESYICANVSCIDDVKKVIADCDIVVHLAAHPLPASLKEPNLNAIVNIGGTLNILDAMRDCGVNKIIFSSASSIVGEVRSSHVTEDHPCVPKTPYGVAKYSTEHYIRVYHELFGIDYLIFRFFNVYGQYQYPASGALIPNVYAKLHAKQPFTVFGDGSATRDYIYVDDIARCYVDAINRPMQNDIVNMGTGVETSILDILELSEEITGITPDITYLPQRPGEIQNFVADVNKKSRIFSSIKTTVLQDGLEKTFSWLRGVK